MCQVTVEQGSGRHQVQKVTEWGRGAGPFTLKPAAYNFNIPHGLALAEDKNEVFVCHLPIGLTPTKGVCGGSREWTSAVL